MKRIYNFIKIPDTDADIKRIAELIAITNIGIEAVTPLYDDHRLDSKIADRMFPLQENLIYRIFAAFHQYELPI